MMKQLGPYRIEKLLGRGGMGSVYAGVHEQTGQRAAIKSLSSSLADDPNFRSRFLVEIETLKQLRHPNIVQILGEGQQDGQLFYVMELVEGKSLQELLQAGHGFTWQDVIRVSVEICSALKHAHDCGVIHRDLKPANLLRTADGTIKLTDFGIAKLFGASHQTAVGSVVGTGDYMSPEQADGRAVTIRTDLYSLGAVMFTLLARRSPFQGGSLAQVMFRLKHEPAPSVRKYVPSVPAALDELIGEMLRKDPLHRPATALSLANRLRSMDHVLNPRTGESQPAEADTSVGERPKADSSTAMVDHDRDSGTQIAPTLGDQVGAGGLGKFSWNDATIETSHQAQLDKTADKLPADATSPPAAHSQAPRTVAEENPTTDRFTTIDDDARRRADGRAVAVPESDGNWYTVAGIAVLLVVLVGLCVWALRPPSADSLYQRIQTIAAREGPDYAWKEMGEFLARFPTDSRYREVNGWRMDVECDWLQSRILLRKRQTDGVGVANYEQQWLDAYLVRHEDPSTARRKWQSILEEYGHDPNPTVSLMSILDATHHQLNRLTATERNE